jgi:hypothetical protein
MSQLNTAAQGTRLEANDGRPQQLGAQQHRVGDDCDDAACSVVVEAHNEDGAEDQVDQDQRDGGARQVAGDVAHHRVQLGKRDAKTVSHDCYVAIVWLWF